MLNQVGNSIRMKVQYNPEEFMAASDDDEDEDDSGKCDRLSPNAKISKCDRSIQPNRRRRSRAAAAFDPQSRRYRVSSAAAGARLQPAQILWNAHSAELAKGPSRRRRRRGPPDEAATAAAAEQHQQQPPAVCALHSDQASHPAGQNRFFCMPRDLHPSSASADVAIVPVHFTLVVRFRSFRPCKRRSLRARRPRLRTNRGRSIRR